MQIDKLFNSTKLSPKYSYIAVIDWEYEGEENSDSFFHIKLEQQTAAVSTIIKNEKKEDKEDEIVFYFIKFKRIKDNHLYVIRRNENDLI